MAMFHFEITEAAAEAYWQNITKAGRAIDLTDATAVAIGFENTEVVTLKPDAIKTFWVAGPVADTFYLRVPNDEACVLKDGTYLNIGGLERLQSDQDIVDFVIVRKADKLTLPVQWSRLSMNDAENLDQHFAHVGDDLVICAQLPRRYLMAALVFAAQYFDNRVAIIEALNDTVAELHGEADGFVNERLATLQDMLDPATFKRQQDVVGDVTRAADGWQATCSVDGKGPIEVSQLSVAQWLEMDVGVEEPDFWAGFAMLLWALKLK